MTPLATLFGFFGSSASPDSPSAPSPSASASDRYLPESNSSDVAPVCLVGTEATCDKLQRQLVQAGIAAPICAEPVIGLSPTTEPAALDAALRRLAEFDWLILLSPPACRFLMDRALALGISPEVLHHPRVAVVGEGTANAARDAGFAEPTVICAGGTASSLAAQLARRDDARGAKILVPRSAAGESDVLQPLVDAGATLTAVETYDNRPLPLDESRWAALLDDSAPPPIVVFLSSSAVTALWSGLPVGIQARLADRARTVAMGPATATTLAQVRWPVSTVAEPPGLPGVIACVQSLLT